MSTILLLIDPQNDFCAAGGSLFVPGAPDDCRRFAAFLDENGGEVDTIYVTLDCHHAYSIFHPMFWRDAAGTPPLPFTTITSTSLKTGEYRPHDASLTDYVASYTAALEAGERYSLTLWPPHCLIGTEGHCVEPTIADALCRWETSSFGDWDAGTSTAHDIPPVHGVHTVTYVLKGQNRLTEHYSALRAEVADPLDSSTGINRALLDALQSAVRNDPSTRILIAGEALSHCVAFTLRDLLNYLPANCFTLLASCTSPVAGFARDTYIEEFAQRGVTISS